MLQVRGVTSVWADWLIYSVRYDSRHHHIEWLFGYADNGASVSGDEKSFTRETVIRAVEQGTTFCTIYKNSAGKWDRGSPLKVINVNGTKYVTTVGDRTAADNLGNLPEK